jgi:hypothetical protein
MVSTKKDHLAKISHGRFSSFEGVLADLKKAKVANNEATKLRIAKK